MDKFEDFIVAEKKWFNDHEHILNDREKSHYEAAIRFLDDISDAKLLAKANQLNCGYEDFGIYFVIAVWNDAIDNNDFIDISLDLYNGIGYGDISILRLNEEFADFIYPLDRIKGFINEATSLEELQELRDTYISSELCIEERVCD